MCKNKVLKNNYLNFSLNFYDKLIELEGEEKNIIFSPYSIYEALLMLHEGSNGITKDELSKIIANINPRNMIEFLKIKNNSNITLNIINSLWKEKTIKILNSYKDTLKSYFDVKIMEADFLNKPIRETERINLYVEKNTNKMIKEIFKTGDLDSTTKLVLLNIIYFKGLWDKKFDKDKNYIDFFYSTKGKTKTEYMKKIENLNFYETPTLLAVKKQFEGKEFSVIFIMKKDNKTKKIAGKEILQVLKNIKSFKNTKIELNIPKIKIEHGFSLKKLLKSLGLETAFNKKADFSKITGEKNIYISKAIHKASVIINEEGSEASAATAISMKLKSASKFEKPLIIKFNRPFVFLIMEDKKNIPIFIGKFFLPQ